MPLVGQKAPSFSAPAVVHGREIVQNFSLEQYLGKQSVVLFFYPKDFTFVCPTELYALQAEREAFEARNVAIVGCSTDTEETHWAWLQTAREAGGIQGVTYPLIADATKTIAANYGVLGGNWYVDEHDLMRFEGFPFAHRGVFLIDESGIIRHMLINDLPLGRNVAEILRTIDMMRHTDTHGEVCPVNWELGEQGFKPNPEDLIAYLKKDTSMASEGGCGGMCGGQCGCGDRCTCNTMAPPPSSAQGPSDVRGMGVYEAMVNAPGFTRAVPHEMPPKHDPNNAPMPNQMTPDAADTATQPTDASAQPSYPSHLKSIDHETYNSEDQ